MSLESILAELPGLTTDEREAVGHKLDELSTEAALGWLSHQCTPVPLPHEHWAKAFAEGGEEALPEDFSLNHDHYIHGVPKEW